MRKKKLLAGMFHNQKFGQGQEEIHGRRTADRSSVHIVVYPYSVPGEPDSLFMAEIVPPFGILESGGVCGQPPCGEKVVIARNYRTALVLYHLETGIGIPAAQRLLELKRETDYVAQTDHLIAVRLFNQFERCLEASVILVYV